MKSVQRRLRTALKLTSDLSGQFSKSERLVVPSRKTAWKEFQAEYTALEETWSRDATPVTGRR
eukprot:4858052-Prorocentrum_lima.AAC.1